MAIIVGNILFIVLWYGPLSLFVWLTICSIRSGDAGGSGMPLDRNANPIRFWLRITFRCIWLLAFAALPIYVVMKTGQLIQ